MLSNISKLSFYFIDCINKTNIFYPIEKYPIQMASFF